jgi:CDP-diacylglycerol--glycerol-3-phosphate 3-phosphatidyltransferase
VRVVLIFLAMVSDSVDGYIARRFNSTSRFGAILDPAMDKFFVISALSALLFEGKISFVDLSMMLSRDFFLLLYGLILTITGKLKTVTFRAIRWGKISTALQFIVLMCLSLGVPVGFYVYYAFMAMGVLAFFELFEARKPATLV